MLISEVVKYINVAFGTDESVLFIEVSLIQECPDRERYTYVYIYQSCVMHIYMYNNVYVHDLSPGMQLYSLKSKGHHQITYIHEKCLHVYIQCHTCTVDII